MQNFGEFNIWLGAEHGVFLRTPNKKWIRNLPEVQMDWVDSVKVLSIHPCLCTLSLCILWNAKNEVFYCTSVETFGYCRGSEEITISNH